MITSENMIDDYLTTEFRGVLHGVSRRAFHKILSVAPCVLRVTPWLIDLSIPVVGFDRELCHLLDLKRGKAEFFNNFSHNKVRAASFEWPVFQ